MHTYSSSKHFIIISSCDIYKVKPDATQDEVDQFIDSDDSTQVFAQSVNLSKLKKLLIFLSLQN